MEEVKQKKKGELVDVQATVMKETLDGINSICETSGLTIGEVIDRLTLKMVPYEADFAIQLAQEQMVICLSGLDEEEYTKAFIEILVVLLAALPTEELGTLGARAIEKRHEIIQQIADMTEMDKNEDSKCFSEIIDQMVKEIKDTRRKDKQ